MSTSTGQTVRFARRTGSGKYVNLSREEVDSVSGGDLAGGAGEYMNYTVHIPPTPDNQPMEEVSGTPMDATVALKAEEQYVASSLFTGGFNSVTRAHLMDKVIDSKVSHPQMAGAKGSACAMTACDGKVMMNERGEDIDPCECRYVL